MKLKPTITVVAILLTQIGPGGAYAQNQEIDVKALLRRIEELEQKVKALEGGRGSNADPELEQKVKILERRGELAEEAAAEKAKTTPVLTAGAEGFGFSSADKDFSLR